MSSGWALAVGMWYSTQPRVKTGVTVWEAGLTFVLAPFPLLLMRPAGIPLRPVAAELGCTNSSVCGARLGLSKAKAFAKYSATHTVPLLLARTPAGLPPKVGTR